MMTRIIKGKDVVDRRLQLNEMRKNRDIKIFDYYTKDNTLVVKWDYKEI